MKILQTKFLLFLFLHTIQTSLKAQNLVPNPGFEDENVCLKYKEKCSPSAWKPTTLKAIKFNQYFPNLKKGVSPKHGLRSISLLLYDGAHTNDRKFIQTKLICPLKKGQQYEIEINYLVLERTIQTFGILFSEKLVVKKKQRPFTRKKPKHRICRK